MILYHFTSVLHLLKIEEAGMLRTTESNIHMTIPHAGSDVVWFTTEPTATLGHGLHGFIDKAAVRFTVDVPDHWVKPWLPWAKNQGIDNEWLGYLVEAGGGMEAAETWMVTFRPVRKDRWTSVELTQEEKS